MKYYLRAMEKEVIIGNKLSEITHMTNFIQEIGNSLQIPPDTIMNISLALEEATANIINHAYPPNEEHEIRMKVNVSEDQLTIQLIDEGTPFNFTQVNETNSSTILEQHFIDTLGIRLIRQIVDEVSYKSENNVNSLIMKKKVDIEMKTEKTMRINICKIEGLTIITIEGRLDTVNAREFEKLILPLMSEKNPDIIVNCEDFTYISSSGIRSLIALQKSVTSNNGKLTLEAMKPEIKKIFDMTGCSSIFSIR